MVPFWYLAVAVLVTVAAAWVVYRSKARLERRARRACEDCLVPVTYAAGRARVQRGLVASAVSAVATVAETYQLIGKIDKVSEGGVLSPTAELPAVDDDDHDDDGDQGGQSGGGYRYPWPHLQPDYQPPSSQTPVGRPVRVRRIPLRHQSPWSGAMAAIQSPEIRRREVAEVSALSRQVHGRSWTPEAIAAMRDEVVCATRELLPNVDRRSNMPVPADGASC